MLRQTIVLALMVASLAGCSHSDPLPFEASETATAPIPRPTEVEPTPSPPPSASATPSSTFATTACILSPETVSGSLNVGAVVVEPQDYGEPDDFVLCTYRAKDRGLFNLWLYPADGLRAPSVLANIEGGEQNVSHPDIAGASETVLSDHTFAMVVGDYVVQFESATQGASQARREMLALAPATVEALQGGAATR